MIVICEECGKNYSLDSKIMTFNKAKFVCKSCDNIITIIKPKEEIQADKAPVIEEIQVTHDTVTAAISAKKSGLRLLHKMLILFLMVPGVFMVVSGFLYYHQLNRLSFSLNEESKKIVTNLSETLISNISQSVGKHCKTYFDGHPKLEPKDFNGNAEFRSIALTSVGEEGYTALYEIPSVEGGPWIMWVHPNPRVIGVDMRTLDKQIPDFPEFWKIFGDSGLKRNKEAKGYYLWIDEYGASRPKFMVCTPIAGTPFVIAATTYMDEFTAPALKMELHAEVTTQKIRNMVLGILVVTLAIISLIITVYSRLLSGRIRTLTDHAERISIGELDTDIDIKSKDEIGDLAQAITRMQDSIRFSIERLRRRRQSVG